ncbi:MAG: pyridoxine 5'-phosphate synthase [Deltaproteobacteria bacterium]|jgi:pyridoxine 5-phosphate synthase|nr:pyridoxine 5'-phosphate synthase [Deltaproteobacteria bacterium]
MTKLSVNLNKIALLRNARGRDFPNVINFAKKFMTLGVCGITVHPRQDERHITVKDTIELGNLLSGNDDVEFNIEGYPSEAFLNLVESTKPAQCTLVPDSPDQLTSDHGWDLYKHEKFVKETCSRLSDAGVRTSIFLDPDIGQVQLAQKTGTDRIELYTEAYAASYQSPQNEQVFEQYKQASIEAQKLGLGVNAGHDLDLSNLAKFLTIDNILEVSIGHVLTIECIEQGMETVIKQYLNICNG